MEPQAVGHLEDNIPVIPRFTELSRFLSCNNTPDLVKKNHVILLQPCGRRQYEICQLGDRRHKEI